MRQQKARDKEGKLKKVECKSMKKMALGIFRGCPVLFYFFWSFVSCPRCDPFLERSQGNRIKAIQRTIGTRQIKNELSLSQSLCSFNLAFLFYQRWLCDCLFLPSFFPLRHRDQLFAFASRWTIQDRHGIHTTVDGHRNNTTTTKIQPR